MRMNTSIFAHQIESHTDRQHNAKSHFSPRWKIAETRKRAFLAFAAASFFRCFSWAYFSSALMRPQWEQAMNDVQMCSCIRCLCTTIFHLTVSVKLYTTPTCVVRNLRSGPFKSRSLSIRAMCTRSRLYMIITWLCGEKKKRKNCECASDETNLLPAFRSESIESPSVNE